MFRSHAWRTSKSMPASRRHLWLCELVVEAIVPSIARISSNQHLFFFQARHAAVINVSSLAQMQAYGTSLWSVAKVILRRDVVSPSGERGLYVTILYLLRPRRVLNWTQRFSRRTSLDGALGMSEEEGYRYLRIVFVHRTEPRGRGGYIDRRPASQPNFFESNALRQANFGWEGLAVGMVMSRTSSDALTTRHSRSHCVALSI
ncbi:uncharacterized protein EV420DRAFT_1636561 [Desarmillaria tabescens]|uniref:Uncharacterized protein n=1 Tax=Armillaria tabescens TaxID=1929756 RepID=A0AA39TTJ3_ARMTA|nr:uncharacterized protein EV420DRAFT_1636561 [Desarmillaria tabescens]KAK0465988.1 hypothetical protein EV420DRAFT_1636561 [Desarmillaria tabescens]